MRSLALRAPVARSVAAGLVILPVLAGCAWADGAWPPLVPQAPAPSSSSAPAQPDVPTPSLPAPGTPTPSSPAPEPQAPGESTVVYTVDGTGTASVTYVLVHGGGVVQESTSSTALPFTTSMRVMSAGSVPHSTMTLAAVGNQNTDTLACSITQDGTVIAEQSASGPFATVTCTATVR